MTSGKIDNPVEASFEAWPPDSANFGERASDLALNVVGISFGPAELFQLLKDQFAVGSRYKRIEYLLNGFRLGFQAIRSEIEDRVAQVNAKLEGEPFRAAVAVACEESARATSKKKIEQMAAVLVGYVHPTPSTWAAPGEDVATMIRDLVQLGDKDILVLGVLATVHASAISHTPNLHDPNAFSAETPTLKTKIAESGIHPDDFLSTCERLRGFGLAAEVLRNTSHMGPQDFCYRPTRRGLLLLDYLKNLTKVTSN
jgi:hypothetical protein